MIDPIDSLAFSIQANPGVYALLLGSGVSRAAQIPTGWEITLDLIRKLAAASGESAEHDPELWYHKKYGAEAPDYSKLIDGVARTQAERQQLLRPYFEPSQQEREENAKQPTAAHRAIAQLVVHGFVKVIITTNVDRLMEKALEDAGVEPTVLSSPDQVKGMLPLVHTRYCVIKVHGDYLDTRIRNTPSELNEYPDEFNQLLDRIFDEFGLIVCGWSANWDIALRDAIFRALSRRFTTYWAVHGEASNEAQRLANHRRAQVIDIEGADKFFEIVQQKVESVEQFSRPHPLSTQAAVASLKRYLSEPRYRIQRSDLIRETVERVVESVFTQAFDMNNPRPDSKTVTARVRAYEAACSTLLSMASIAGSWAADDNFHDWERAMDRLCRTTTESGYRLWLGLRTYPAILLLYALGLGAVESDRLEILARIFKKPVNDDSDGGTTTALTKLLNNIAPLVRDKLLEGTGESPIPINDWLHDILRQPSRQFIPDDSRYLYTFDKFEMLVSFGHHHLNKSWTDWFPLGAFVYRSDNRQRILTEMKESIRTLETNSPLVSSDIFGETSEECMALIAYFENYVVESARKMGIFW